MLPTDCASRAAVSPTYQNEADGLRAHADGLGQLPGLSHVETFGESPARQVGGAGDPRDHQQPRHHVKDPALGRGEVVVEVRGQPRQQDEEAVVLTKVAYHAGPASERDKLHFRLKMTSNVATAL